ncbi:MAG: hypothetical protein ACJ742_20235, partial [Actinomycetes bacterium]
AGRLGAWVHGRAAALAAAERGPVSVAAGVVAGPLPGAVRALLPEGSGGPRGGAPGEREGAGEPRGGAPVEREGSGEPRGGAPVDREGSGEPRGGSRWIGEGER